MTKKEIKALTDQELIAKTDRVAEYAQDQFGNDDTMFLKQLKQLHEAMGDYILLHEELKSRDLIEV